MRKTLSEQVFKEIWQKSVLRKQVLLLKTLSNSSMLFHGFVTTQYRFGKNLYQEASNCLKSTRTAQCYSYGFLEQKCIENIKQNLEHLPESKQYCLKSTRDSSMLFLWVSRDRNFALKISYKISTKSRAPTRKQVMLFKLLKLLKTLSEQLKFKEIWQKSVPGSKYYCLKHCRNRFKEN